MVVSQRQDSGFNFRYGGESLQFSPQSEEAICLLFLQVGGWTVGEQQGMLGDPEKGPVEVQGGVNGAPQAARGADWLRDFLQYLFPCSLSQ